MKDEWLDVILDRVSEYKLENITRLEKNYLENFKDSEYIKEQLDTKILFYEDICKYEIRDAYFYDPNIWTQISEETKKDIRLNLFWENMEMDDSESFMKIYKIPNIYLDFSWNNLPNKYKTKFEDFWKSYYKFNI